MPNNKIIQILRGDANAIANNPNMVLLDGQPLYNKTDNLIYVGDGETALSSLNSINAKTDGNGEDIVDTYARKDGEYPTLSSGSLVKDDHGKVTGVTVGTSRLPIYFDDGVPLECGSTIDVSVSGTASTITQVLPEVLGGTGSETLEGAGIVTVDSTQTITGEKTFSNTIGTASITCNGNLNCTTNSGTLLVYDGNMNMTFGKIELGSSAATVNVWTRYNLSGGINLTYARRLDLIEIIENIGERLYNLGFSSGDISSTITLGNGWSVTQNSAMNNNYTKQGGVVIIDASFSVDVGVSPYDDDRSWGTKTWTIGKLKSGFIPKNAVSTKGQVFYAYSTGTSGTTIIVPASLTIDTSGNVTVSFEVTMGWTIAAGSDVIVYIYSLGYFIKL